MTASSSRPYVGPADQDAMLDMVRARPAARFDDFPGIIDLQEMLGLEEIRANTCLWEDDEHDLVGYAILDETNLFYELATPDLFPQVLTWAEQQLRAAAPESPVLETSCREADVAWIEMLERHGFVRQDGGAVHMRCSLRDPLPEPVLPADFTIRPIAGEQEVEAHVALHRAAWGTENMMVEYRLAMMRTPTYDPTLDLVVVAPDGRLAAYCMCYISPEENRLSGRQDGYTDPMATHPDFQRRGLAKALMLAGMHLLRERGMEAARLSTGCDNVVMQRAAAGVGFQVDFRTVWFARSL